MRNRVKKRIADVVGCLFGGETNSTNGLRQKERGNTKRKR